MEARALAMERGFAGEIGAAEVTLRERLRATLGSILRVPIFWKILLANVAVVLLCVAGTVALLEIQSGRAADPAEALLVAGPLILAGVAATILVNALLLRLAFAPLVHLERAAARVAAGELDARAPISPLADQGTRRLIGTFNRMLEQSERLQGRIRKTAARALESAEEERRRISLELHDDTAQSLTNVLVRLRTARAAASDAERDRQLDRVRQELVHVIDGTRRIAHGLRPPALDLLGLTRAIESLAMPIGCAAGFNVVIDSDDLSGLLTPAAELAVYRIVQEAISNVARHAGAARVRIELRRRPDGLVVRIEDDGCGFSLEAVADQPGRGLGIFGMEERTGYLGGRFRVRSMPGRGTRIELEIPASGLATRTEMMAHA